MSPGPDYVRGVADGAKWTLEKLRDDVAAKAARSEDADANGPTWNGLYDYLADVLARVTEGTWQLPNAGG